MSGKRLHMRLDPRLIWQIEESLNRQHQRERRMASGLAKMIDRREGVPEKAEPKSPPNAECGPWRREDRA